MALPLPLTLRLCAVWIITPERVFEFVSDGLTVCGGGRYDNLVEEIGGKPQVRLALVWVLKD